MIINTASLAALFIGFNSSFQKGLSSQADPDWKKIAAAVPSSTSKNLYAWLERWPKMRRWVGDRLIKALKAHSYEVENLDYESTVGISANAIKDDVLGSYKPMFEMEGFAAANHPAELLFALLAAGNSTLCYDGQYFLDTDHPVGTGTVANFAAGGSNLWALMDTNWPIKPLIFQEREKYKMVSLTRETDENVFMRNELLYGVTARVAAGYGFWQMCYGSTDTLNVTNFNAAIAAMLAFKDDEGRALGIDPNILVVGPSNRAAALALVKTERDAAGASNVNFKAVDLLVTTHLT